MLSGPLCLAVLAAMVVLCGCVSHAEYLEAEAMSALYFSKASYCEAPDITNWSCESCGHNASFQVKGVYEHYGMGTQAYLGVGEDRIVMAFRGSSNSANWVSNLDLTRATYPNANCAGCSVHKGFLASFNSLWPQILPDFQELRKQHGLIPILVTGHSLGGALATLAAVNLAVLTYPSGEAPHIDLYTFGSPRVGNRAFADWASTQLVDGGHTSYRIVQGGDVVPHFLTMGSGYAHVSQEVWYSDDYRNPLSVCDDAVKQPEGGVVVWEDPDCSNALWYPYSSADHLQYLGVCTSCTCEPTSPPRGSKSKQVKAVRGRRSVV